MTKILFAQEPTVILQQPVSFMNCLPLSTYVLSNCRSAVSFLQATGDIWVRLVCMLSEVTAMQTHVKTHHHNDSPTA